MAEGADVQHGAKVKAAMDAPGTAKKAQQEAATANAQETQLKAARKDAEQAAAEASADLDEVPVTSVLLKVKCNAVRTLASHS